jgi:hypothetical protein
MNESELCGDSVGEKELCGRLVPLELCDLMDELRTSCI